MEVQGMHTPDPAALSPGIQGYWVMHRQQIWGMPLGCRDWAGPACSEGAGNWRGYNGAIPSSGKKRNSRACCGEGFLWEEGVKGQGCSELEEEGALARPQAASGGVQGPLAGGRLVRLEVEYTHFQALEAGPPVSLDVAFVGVEYRRPPHPAHSVATLDPMASVCGRGTLPSPRVGAGLASWSL